MAACFFYLFLCRTVKDLQSLKTNQVTQFYEPWIQPIKPVLQMLHKLITSLIILSSSELFS